MGCSMIRLDDPVKWSAMSDEAAVRVLRAPELAEYEAMPREAKTARWEDLLCRPIDAFTMLNEVFFRARWEQVLRWQRTQSRNPDAAPVLLEIASGDADMIPQMMARVFPGSRYVTANMNRALTESLMGRTAGLPLTMQVIEEDAAYLADKLGENSVDVVAFQHGANDVLQAILCERDGIDTVYADWMAVLPDMIRILRHEVAEGTLEQSVKAPFLGLLRTLSSLVRSDGVIAINHYMFQLDLDWGYPPELFERLIPMIRSWLPDCAGLRETLIQGFHPNWWLFLRKA
mgnify:CR=1 FL=1